MRTQIPINVPAWWLIIMPVLMIILIGIIVLVAINIVNTKQKETEDKDEKDKNKNSKDKNSKDKTLTSWIKKKDLLYWLLIMCLGTISLFTFRYKDATEVITHWGFAGTIVSIILAVVAIGFTLFQTLSSNLSSEKIAVSADKIEKATIDLDSERLTESSKIMNETADFLKKKLSFFEDKLNSINSSQEQISKLAQSGFEKMYSSNASERDRIDIIELDSFVNEFLPKTSYLVVLFTYMIFKLHLNNQLVTREVKTNISKKLAESHSSSGISKFFNGSMYASIGIVDVFIKDLGILNKFEEIPQMDKESVINKCSELINSFKGIESNDLSIIDEYIQSLTEGI